VSNLHCNGSHGISIGSLGQYATEVDIVENVFVTDVYMANAQNGARIKVFGGSPYANSTAGGGTGYVRNITFQVGSEYCWVSVQGSDILRRTSK
jgi:galacturan 1,4-alpha-galacturonidase